MKNNSGFTLLELLCGLFICSLILVFLVPNLILEYKKLKEIEHRLVAKEILYEELMIHDGDNFQIERDGYLVKVTKNRAQILDLKTGDEIIYE